MVKIPTFTEEQITAAKDVMPKRMSERATAACMGIPLSVLIDLRINEAGPEHVTLVNGDAIYTRRQVLHWMHSHKEPRHAA
ncbi:hypothetical protein [Bifidobacterium simiiventris]|uniref:hypothetical protein n=1 Tax=Bifidobacterium simiiventris TaxID=2834434 RepID=UPI001C58EFCA|nr:hypothetical protein [Bifidobacterium simiiventris]MBW3078231.1 hypothetical protein [Bifidobacterium simiiventris]